MPPTPDPPPRFLITDYHHGFALGELHIKLITDITCHLWARHTDKPLRMHNLADPTRGTFRMKYPYFCFVEFHELEQLEPGDTLHHRFHMPAFGPGIEKWYYFYGYKAGFLCNSVSAIFHVKYDEESEMITLGIYSEDQVLQGEVKLEAGDSITLIRNDAHNSIEIHATAAAPTGFGFPWTTTWTPDPPDGYTHWDYDELTIMLREIGLRVDITTGRMWLYNPGLPHSMTFAFSRGAYTLQAPTLWAALTDYTNFLIDSPTKSHIAFVYQDNILYASNANNTARTSTAILSPVTAWHHWLSWERKAASIDFYLNGALAVTHNTNLPGNAVNGRFTFQGHGYSNYVRLVHFTHPAFAP